MQNAVMMRERQLNVRLSEAEGVRFDAVATHYGLNAQALVRMLVKKEADALGVAPAPTDGMFSVMVAAKKAVASIDRAKNAKKTTKKK